MINILYVLRSEGKNYDGSILPKRARECIIFYNAGGGVWWGKMSKSTVALCLENHFILASPIANAIYCPFPIPHSCRVVNPQTLRTLNLLTPGSALSTKSGYQEHSSPPRSWWFFFSGKICLIIQNSRTRNANLEIFSEQVKKPGDAISGHLGAFGSQKFSCTLRANLWWRSA